MKPHLAIAAAAALAAATPASAQYTYLGEVELTGNATCPGNTLAADGTLLPAAGNGPLATLLGTTFGGDANNVALPDLRGRAAVGAGQPPYAHGTAGGNESVTLSVQQMAPHQHRGYLWTLGKPANVDDPTGASIAILPNNLPGYLGNTAPTVSMANGSVSVDNAGGGQPYDNMKPYVALRYCVVTSGAGAPPR